MISVSGPLLSGSRFKMLRVGEGSRIAGVPNTASVAALVRWVRHERVLLDFDVAAMYGVETRVLKQAVRRNRDRFPQDFMFELTTAEAKGLVSQSVIPGLGQLGGSLPFAFTEGGIAMLSSVLRSPRAIEVNIAIMRTFAQLRRLMDSNRELARRIESSSRSSMATTNGSPSYLLPSSVSSRTTGRDVASVDRSGF
jgi:hypothetical protein